MITWDESMITGVDDLDVQHKKLIQKFNEFSQVMTDGHARETAGDVLDFLQFYATWHFEREEACMAEHQCPIAARNKQSHAEFLQTFNQFYKQWQENIMDDALIEQTFSELSEWIANHIRGIDTQLRPCVSA